MNKEIGRNDPCPCGSGKKYKKCCALKPGGKQRTFTQVKSMNSQAALSKVTKVLSQSLRESHPEASKKMEDLVKKRVQKSDEDLDPKK